MIRRCSIIALEVVGFLVAGMAILAGLLAWRLSSGPIEADFLTPYLESAMSEGAVRLSLGRTLVRWDGFGRPLAFVAVDLQLTDRDGNTVATVPEVEMALSVPRLLLGGFGPERIDLVRPKLHVTRTESGDFAFTLGDRNRPVDAAGNVDVIQALLTSLRAPPGSSDVPMSALRRLEVTGAEIVVDDRYLGVTWVVPKAEITLDRAEDAIRGGMLLDLEIGGRLAALSAELDYFLATDTSRLEVGLANFVPAELAGLDPLLDPLAVIAMPVFGTIAAEFGPELSPDRMAFVLQGGAGQLRLEEVYEMPLPVAGVALSGVIDVAGNRVAVDRFAVDLGGPTVRGSASVTDLAGVLEVDAEGTLEDMPIDLLATYWPEALASTTREWVTGNLSLGMVRRATTSFRARVPRDRPDETDVGEIGGTIEFDGIRVNYLDGLPAVDDVAGVATYDAENFVLALDGGQLRDVSMTGADIVITGFDQPINTIDIEVVVSGPARTTLEVVDSPRLSYVSQLGLDPSTTSGSLAGRVRFTFPLMVDVGFDQIAVAAAANLVDVAIDDPVLGSITDINGALTLDGRGMTIVGDAALSDLPLTFEWNENFADDRAHRTRLAANGTIGKADAERLGLDVYGPWAGALAVQAVYTDLDRRHATLAAEVDLTDASIRLDEIGWHKPLGEPGVAVLEAALTDDSLAAIPSFAIDGAGLAVRGSASFEAGGEDVSQILLTEFRHGETDLSAQLTQLPDGGYAVNAYGTRLDARPLLENAVAAATEDAEPLDEPEEPGEETEAPTAEEELTPLQVTVAFDEVVAGDGGKLYSVSGIAARDRQGWNEFDLVARTDTGAQVQSRYEPIRPAGHQFSLTAEDAGAALRALDFSENIFGGRLSVTGVQVERSGPLEGSIDLQDYRAVNMPALGRLLAALSLGGLQNVLSTEGLTFQKLTGEYGFADDVLTLRNTRTAGGALGLTMAGEFDVDAGLLDMEGTIVPIYGVNQLIGAIPILGDLLTGGSGQGILAFTYTVEGPIKEPEVAVNPLSVLAPGFLRNLFFLDSGLGQTGVEQPDRRPRLNDDD